MKNHFLQLLVGFLIVIACLVVAAIQSSIEVKAEAKTKAEAKAEVAEELQVAAVEKLLASNEETVSLRRALAMKEEQRKHTQALVDFLMDHETFCVVVADEREVIVDVNGLPRVLRWSREGLLGAKVRDTRPVSSRARHSSAIDERVEEGRSGRVYMFEEEAAVSEDGEIFYLNGIVLWHAERHKFVGIFAPPVE